MLFYLEINEYRKIMLYCNALRTVIKKKINKNSYIYCI